AERIGMPGSPALLGSSATLHFCVALDLSGGPAKESSSVVGSPKCVSNVITGPKMSLSFLTTLLCADTLQNPRRPRAMPTNTGAGEPRKVQNSNLGGHPINLPGTTNFLSNR